MINRVLSEYPNHIPYVLQSTGKDSVVTEHLCKLSNYNVQTVFNNTTLDCADTYRIVNKHRDDWIITNPKEGFYQYIKRANFIPTRFSRGCCNIFKEGNHVNHFKDVEKAIWIMGVRNEESPARQHYGDIDKNPKWGDRDWLSLQPIRKWSELELWCYTLYNNLEINPKYKKGYKRCGCSIACPYTTKTTWVLDKYFYPYQYNRWHNILEEFFVKNSVWGTLNCTIEEFHSCWNGGVVREQPTEKVIQEFMVYSDISDSTAAKQYFNKKCENCGKKVRKKEVVAMNLKIYGRGINKFKCKKCLMKDLGWTSEDWDKNVEDFKAQGCTLF